MPTAKESAKDHQADVKERKKEDKEEAESQEIEEVPEGDPPTPFDAFGTGKADSQEKVHEAVEDGPNVEGEEPASEPVTETKSNEVSVDQADQHIYVDEITPGGTQINNPTPNVLVRGDSYIGPINPDPAAPKLKKINKSGAFPYKWDRNNPTFYLERPENPDITSAVAVAFVGDEVPQGTYSPNYVNKEEGIYWTTPVNVTQDHFEFTLPHMLEEQIGREDTRLVILDNEGKQAALSSSFNFI